jgi:predicted dehydrogenase
MEQRSNSRSPLSRRDFLAASAASTALMTSGNFAYAAAADTLKVGVIGVGGRGRQAGEQSVQSSEGVVIHAVGDLFEDRATAAKDYYSKTLGDKYKAGDRVFTGFDAYKKVIDSGVDLVVLATPPGFRPMHLRYAIEKGKHVFMEKPVAVDGPGVRSVIESAKMAAGKGLGIVAGTQRRHEPPYVETIKRIHDGEMGDVVGGSVYWNQGGLWHKAKESSMSDMEWQIRNWLYFSWLSGDHIVEQHIHNLDVANWVMNAHPVKITAMGGRQARTDSVYGHIYDHFAAELEYPNGVRILSMARQIDNCANKVDEHFVGTKGNSRPASWIRDGGSFKFRYDGPKPNPYVQEHTDLIASIRAGKPLNEGIRVAESTLTAIMVRESAYSGEELTWDKALNSTMSLAPEKYEFGPLGVAPVAIPGKYKLV